MLHQHCLEPKQVSSNLAVGSVLYGMKEEHHFWFPYQIYCHVNHYFYGIRKIIALLFKDKLWYSGLNHENNNRCSEGIFQFHILGETRWIINLKY